VQNAGATKAEVYPLLGDRYLLGRSSKSCDIVVRNPVISQIHLSLTRASRQRQAPFIIKDENSTNGIYRGKRQVTALELRHGDVFTLGPPELAASVRLQYFDPPLGMFELPLGGLRCPWSNGTDSVGNWYRVAQIPAVRPCLQLLKLR
jgi:hypothetical protein